MNYFMKVELAPEKVKKGQSQLTLYPVYTDIPDEEPSPILKKEKLWEMHQYQGYLQRWKPKGKLIVDYAVYKTEEKIDASTKDEVFETLIQDADNQDPDKDADKKPSDQNEDEKPSEQNADNKDSNKKADNKKTERVTSATFELDPTEYKNSRGEIVKKKQFFTKKNGIICLVVLAAFGVAFFGMYRFGVSRGRRSVGTKIPAAPVGNATEDGLIIPEQNEINEYDDQITVTIDRSYSPTPVEDLQLKGAVKDGKAVIELPKFDKTDYFTHVSGYSWGFTSDPNGKKIEYYGGRQYEFAANTKLYRVLVKYGGGNGTKDDPYLIDYFDQLELMGKEKARGYFRQTADITFPDWAVHTPISTVNELKADPQTEYFEYDGGGYVIENLNAPLFDKVSGAVIKNVNVRSSTFRTQEYHDYGMIVCNAYNYHYKAEDGTIYETGETLIQHCTVSHSAILAEMPNEEETAGTTTAIVTAPEVVPPDVIEYDEEGNPIETATTPAPEKPKKADCSVGAITGNGGQIEDCYVTDFRVSANLEDYLLYVGGISGKPANIRNSVVYDYTAEGNIFHAGGIVGSAEGTRTYDANGQELPNSYGGNIQGCVARDIKLSSETSAGGIAAIGSTDAENALISNCYVNELEIQCGIITNQGSNQPEQQGTIGGVVALDGAGRNGHILSNTVSPSSFGVIGKEDKSEWDDTVRLAPAYAFYQGSILTVINRNTVNPADPKEIFTGCFMFGEENEFGDENGNLAFPETIQDLFEKTLTEEESQNG